MNRPRQITLLIVVVALCCTPSAFAAPRAATVRMKVAHNRAIVTVEFVRSDGSVRPARAWVDTGNQEFLISEELARDLGMDLFRKHVADNSAVGGARVAVTAPKLRLAKMPLNSEGVSTYVITGRDPIFPGLRVDANLPATILSRYEVVLDYPARRFTMAEPGTLAPRGARVPAKVNRSTGLIDMAATIGGRTCAVALDNGASYGMLTDTMVRQLTREHPEWPHRIGATGAANMWGIFPREAELPLIKMLDVRWGSVPLQPGAMGVPDAFAEWYSKKTAEPVVGVFGPDALRPFRVTIDYVGQAVYFEQRAPFVPHDMDMVGLTLKPLPDGSFEVMGAAPDGGAPGVQPGDKLLRVGRLRTQDQDLSTVVHALRGKPGKHKKLVLERGGKKRTVRATVMRLW